MLKRVVLIALVVVPKTILAATAPAAAATTAARAEPVAAKTQVQAESPSPAAPGPEAATKSAQTTTYQFAAAPYIGLSAGPRNNYTGKPNVYKGFEFILSAGAATMLTEKLYFAGEIYLGSSVKIKNFPNPMSVRSAFTYGLDVLPGYMVTHHVLGYLRFGVANTDFISTNSGVTAWRIGIGGETNLCKRWDIRGEYVYSGYKRVRIGKPASDQFNLGLLYKFT